MTANVLQEIESTIRKSEQAVLDAIESWARTAREMLPDAPVTLPFADRLPTPKQVVSSVYNAAEAMLASQRKFAERALELFPGESEKAA
jgi:hypothetical protein